VKTRNTPEKKNEKAGLWRITRITGRSGEGAFLRGLEKPGRKKLKGKKPRPAWKTGIAAVRVLTRREKRAGKKDTLRHKIATLEVLKPKIGTERDKEAFKNSKEQEASGPGGGEMKRTLEITGGRKFLLGTGGET